MSEPPDARRRADREAAEWHVRLGERPVSADALSDFKTWRSSPLNTEAWRRLETLWRASGTLAGDPEIQALTQDVMRRSAPRARRRRLAVLWSGVGVIAAGAILVLALAVWIPTRNVYDTAVGEQRLVRLADGTQVRLDTNTRLQVRFSGDERRVRLDRGQALFTVAHEAKRPFRVTAGATEITALGTVFDVRREPQGARVTLVSGSVGVTEIDDRRSQGWRLAPGQQLTTSSDQAAPQTVDVAVATSWSDGRLIFRNTPLREAVAEVNRYLPDKIVLASGAPREVAVNGVFVAGDRDAFVSAASDLFGLQARTAQDGSLHLSAPAAGG